MNTGVIEISICSYDECALLEHAIIRLSVMKL